MSEDYYQVLQVQRDAAPPIIRSAYRTLMNEMGMHPDKGGSTDRAKKINEAYEVLSDPDRRREYDRSNNFCAAGVASSNSPAASDSATGDVGGVGRSESPRPRLSRSLGFIFIFGAAFLASGWILGIRFSEKVRLVGTPVPRHLDILRGGGDLSTPIGITQVLPVTRMTTQQKSRDRGGSPPSSAEVARGSETLEFIGTGVRNPGKEPSGSLEADDRLGSPRSDSSRGKEGKRVIPFSAAHTQSGKEFSKSSAGRVSQRPSSRNGAATGTEYAPEGGGPSLSAGNLARSCREASGVVRSLMRAMAMGHIDRFFAHHESAVFDLENGVVISDLTSVLELPRRKLNRKEADAMESAVSLACLAQLEAGNLLSEFSQAPRLGEYMPFGMEQGDQLVTAHVPGSFTVVYVLRKKLNAWKVIAFGEAEQDSPPRNLPDIREELKRKNHSGPDWRFD